MSQATGRDFAIRGALSIRLLPGIVVVANDLSLGNARWASRKDMLTVRQARLDVALWPLLQRRVEIQRVSLQGVDLLLETDAAGVGNWVMAGRDAAAATAGTAPAAPAAATSPLGDVARVQLSDAHVGYRTARGGSAFSLDLQQLAVDRAAAGQRLDARFAMKGQAWQLSGPVGRLGSLADPQSDWPFDLELRSDGARLSVKGQLLRGSPARALAADVVARIDKVAGLAPWVGDAANTLLPIELKTTLSYAPPKIQAEAVQLTMAEQRLQGRVSITDVGAWKFDAQLASPSIDLARWLPKRAAAPAGPAAAPKRWVFDETPIPFDALPGATGTLALQVDRLHVPGLPEISALRTRLDLRPRRLKIEPLSFAAAGGSVRAGLGLNLEAAAAPRSTLELEAKDLSVDTLMLAAGTTGYASGGRMQLRAALDLAGKTPRAMAAGAGGEVTLSVAGTTLGQGASPLGTDVLRRLLQALTLRPDLKLSSRIDCAVMRLPLKNGIAAIDRSIAFETDQLAVSAKGQLRFDDETLALAFTPAPKLGVAANPLDLARLVVLKGPWRDPKVQLDAQGLIGVAASLGLAGATGGASLIAQQLLQGKAETDVCRTALSGGTAPTPSTAPAAPARPASAVLPAGLPQALPEALRRIFK